MKKIFWRKIQNHFLKKLSHRIESSKLKVIKFLKWFVGIGNNWKLLIITWDLNKIHIFIIYIDHILIQQW